MWLVLIGIENVRYVDSTRFEEIGNHRAMTSPPDCFRAHDRRWPGVAGKIDKTVDAFAKFFCLHGIGIAAK